MWNLGLWNLRLSSWSVHSGLMLRTHDYLFRKAVGGPVNLYEGHRNGVIYHVLIWFNTVNSSNPMGPSTYIVDT